MYIYCIFFVKNNKWIINIHKNILIFYLINNKLNKNMKKPDPWKPFPSLKALPPSLSPFTCKIK